MNAATTHNDARENYFHSFFDAELQRPAIGTAARPATEKDAVWAVLNALYGLGEKIAKAEWDEAQLYRKWLRGKHFADRKASNARLEALGGADKGWTSFKPVDWFIG